MPSVMFVCSTNQGKSQMAAALARQEFGPAVTVYSAGLKPGKAVNQDAARLLVERGASTEGEHPKAFDEELARSVDKVVMVGTNAQLDPALYEELGAETWDVVEPSLDGIEGDERLNLMLDDMDARVKDLGKRLGL